MSWQDFEIIGFAPDLPSNIPGIIFSSSNSNPQSAGMYPTAKGFRNGPTPETLSTTGGTSGALDTVPLGSMVSYTPNGTPHIYVGTAAKIWEYDGVVTITDRTLAAGGSATATDPWSFCQFGDFTVAACRGNFLSGAFASGQFVAVGGAPTPKASICVTCGPVSAPFVMVFDFNDGTNDYRDGWFNSAINDPLTGGGASWTTGTSQCAQGRLLDELSGPIVCAIPFRDDVLAWKPRGMYIGSYGTKLETGWSWERRSHDVGALGKNCAARVDDMIYWSSLDGLWMYDGSYPRRVPGHFHNWWRERVQSLVSSTNRHLARTVWDPRRRVIWFMLPDSSTQTTGIAYHVDSQLTYPVYQIKNTAATTTAYHMVAPYDKYMVFVDTNKKLGLLTYEASSGGPAASTMTFGVIGDNINQWRCTGFRPAILKTTLGSTTATCGFGAGPFWRDDMTALTNSATFTSNGTKLWQDGTVTDRFLQAGLTFAADNYVEIAAKGGKIDLTNAGTGGA